jgi:transposase
LKEQIAFGTFEWAVSHIIDKTGMPSFEKNYRNDASGLRPAGAGCPPPKEAYPPALLLKAILFCPSRGIITPRKIERSCKDNIITKALAEDLEPGRDTIASFISTNNEEVKDLFCQVLFKCSGLKLITGKMSAIGGCKLPPDASKECSGKNRRTEKEAGQA